MIEQVFLDMDGVLTDFIGAASRFLGLSYSHEDYTDWDAIYDYYDGSVDQFWREFPEEFWSDYIGWMPDGKKILAVVEPYDPVILTCPGPYSGGQGKIDWIRNHLPHFYESGRYLLGPAKMYVSRPGTILIDDGDHNIEDWEINGGWGILVPRPWNAGRYPRMEPVQWVQMALRYYDFFDVRKLGQGGTA